MPIVIQDILTALGIITQELPIGTNLGLLQFMWMLVSGQLLRTRGAIFPALQGVGLDKGSVRRAWAAFRYGSWAIEALITGWQDYVLTATEWQAKAYEGYHPKAVDLTGFFRPTLQGNIGQHYHPQAGKALPAIELGIVGVVGQLNAQRILLPSQIIRADPADMSEKDLKIRVVEQVGQQLARNEVAVFDAGFTLRLLHKAQIKRYVVRLPKNFVARRNQPSPYQGKGRKPVYGEWVRPLARSYQGRAIAATPPDHTVTWQEGKVTLSADIWENLVLPGVIPNIQSTSFRVIAVHDPRYTLPLLLATSLQLQALSIREIYRDRWPVEQVPLAAKQMLGAHRQFVSAPEACQRLPELALLAGSILTVMAAASPPIPTGFWDRNPLPTPGRLRRLLMRFSSFPDIAHLSPRFRKKRALIAHLPKGIWGHRRSKKVA